MPPKAKFTREEVIQTSLAILREEGRSALTARALGARLNSSARPVFTLFSGMDEILCETEKAARKLYDSYVQAGLKEKIPFKGVGLSYLRFAKEEPKLFQYLFLSERKGTTVSILPEIDDNYEAILSSVITGYGLDREKAQKLYLHLWIFTHGIATLIASRACKFTDEEIEAMLGEVIIGLLKKWREEK
ncbi:MAG: WHG domain-containing protein [Clostridiales bacterium]|nr:WHG domain-containing protein [Clostridiales bacterium]